ncbi:4229_t:CDS:2, partial [Acaulospora morrowiae]
LEVNRIKLDGRKEYQGVKIVVGCNRKDHLVELPLAISYWRLVHSGTPNGLSSP